MSENFFPPTLDESSTQTPESTDTNFFPSSLDGGSEQTPSVSSDVPDTQTQDTQHATNYNGDHTALDSKDLGNALSVGNNISAVGHTLTGLIGLVGDVLGGGVNLVKNVVTGNGDAIGEQAKTLGTNVGNMAGNLLNEGTGLVEGGVSALGGSGLVNSIDSGAQNRVNVLKERLSTDGALGVALDLFPFAEGAGAIGKLRKVKGAITDGAIADAGAIDGGVGGSAITDNLKNLTDPATPTGGMLSQFVQKLMSNPIINNPLTRTAVDTAGAVGKAGGKIAETGADFAKNQVGAGNLDIRGGMQAGTDLYGKEGVSAMLSNVIKNADTSSEISKTLSAIHNDITGKLEDSGAGYKNFWKTTSNKKVEINKPPVIEYTDGGAVINSEATVKGNPLLSALQKKGLKAKLELNENGVPQITGFSKTHGLTGLSDSEMSQLATNLNKAGVLSHKMNATDFVKARKSVSDIAFSNRTGAIVDMMKEVRMKMNDLYRPKIDETFSGENLTSIDAVHEKMMNTIQELKDKKILTADGTVHPTFAKKLTNITKNGKLADEATQGQLESMAKAMDIDSETLRKQLVWDSFTDELKKVVSKDTKTGMTGSLLGYGAVAHFGLPAMGALVLTQLLKNPETFVQVLKLGQKVIGTKDAITSYTVDNITAKLKNGIELTPEQHAMATRLTRKAFSQMEQVGFATINMVANKQATGENTPNPTTFVPPTQQQTDLSNYLINK